MSRLDRVAATTALLCAFTPAAVAAAAVKRPSGTYTGEGGRVTLEVARGVIALAALDFPCRDTRGRVTFSDVRITKRRKAWRFSLLIYGTISYTDGHADENGRFRFSGRFSPSARAVVGRLSMRSPYCGSPSVRRWSAARSRR